MKVAYNFLPDYQFPHWIDHSTKPASDNLTHFMNVNEWCGKQFGDLGVNWGYERKTDTSSAPNGMNPVRVRLHHTTIHYSWRFKNKEDAALFKLTWGGA